MSTEPAPNRFAGSPLPINQTVQDVSSVATEQTVTNPKKNGRSLREFFVKFEFPQQDRARGVPILQNHRQILCSILNAHKDQVTLFDKNENPLDQTKLNAIRSMADHRALFDIHTKDGNDRRKTRHTIIMMIRSTLSLTDIRSANLVAYQLTHLHIFLRMHHFPLNTFDVASIGWLRDVHPTQMDHDTLKHSIDTAIKASCGDSTIIPFYNLSFCSPAFQEENKTPMRTKAIEIQVERKYVRLLDGLIKKAFAHHPIYVPWRQKYKEPNHYRLNLRAQFKYLVNTWTLPLVGINRYEMYHLERHIIATGLVSSVQPTRLTDSVGRWNLLIHRDQLRASTTAVTEIINNYPTLVPPSSECAKWTTPRQVGSGHKHTEDLDSEGDNSYASASMASLTSLLTLDDRIVPVTTTSTAFDFSQMETPPAQPAAAPTYAQVTQPNPAASSAPSENELRLTNQVNDLTTKLVDLTARLESALSSLPSTTSLTAQDNSPAPPVPASVPADSSDENPTLSTVTPDAVMARQIAFENTMNLGMQKIFEKLGIPYDSTDESNHVPPTDTNLTADASSPSKPPPNKKIDIKPTPPKSHSLENASLHQHP